MERANCMSPWDFHFPNHNWRELVNRVKDINPEANITNTLNPILDILCDIDENNKWKLFSAVLLCFVDDKTARKLSENEVIMDHRRNIIYGVFIDDRFTFSIIKRIYWIENDLFNCDGISKLEGDKVARNLEEMEEYSRYYFENLINTSGKLGTVYMHKWPMLNIQTNNEKFAKYLEKKKQELLQVVRGL